MNDDAGCGGFLALAVVLGALWFWLGDPARDVRRLLGQANYEDRVADLVSGLKAKPIGQSHDQWLVKNGFAGPEKVALFFGYVSDFDACYEFAQMYMQQYPTDLYYCEYAN